MTSKRHYEINWPLVNPINLIWENLLQYTPQPTFKNVLSSIFTWKKPQNPTLGDLTDFFCEIMQYVLISQFLLINGPIGLWEKWIQNKTRLRVNLRPRVDMFKIKSRPSQNHVCQDQVCQDHGFQNHVCHFKIMFVKTMSFFF